MSSTIPKTEPISVRIGDSWQWRREDLANYPASAWVLSYHFRNADSYFDINATADGDDFAINVDPIATGAFVAGRYTWYAIVTDGTDRYSVGEGTTEVLPDVATAAAYDGRSWARRMLDAVEAALENRATKEELDLIGATLGDTGYTRDRAGLIKLRTSLELEVRRAEKNESPMRRIVTRFH